MLINMCCQCSEIYAYPKNPNSRIVVHTNNLRLGPDRCISLSDCSCSGFNATTEEPKNLTYGWDTKYVSGYKRCRIHANSIVVCLFVAVWDLCPTINVQHCNNTYQGNQKSTIEIRLYISVPSAVIQALNSHSDCVLFVNNGQFSNFISSMLNPNCTYTLRICGM